MKKIKILFILILGLSVHIHAQDAINFTAVEPVEGDMSQQVANALKLKVEQILSRNGAGATSMYNAFVVEPQLNLLEEMSTEGLIRNVSLIKAELTLLAKNALDGSLYGSIVVPISGNGKGSKDETLRALIANVKATDSQYARFIRNARQKVIDHYTQNCGTIVQKAQVMINTGKCNEAIAYLGCVPETVPCYEQASEALVQAYGLAKNTECESQILMARNYLIRHKYDEALDVLTKIPQSSNCNAEARALTDSVQKYINIPPEVIEVEKEVIKEVPVEKIVEKEVIKEVPVEKIVVKEVPVAAPAASAPALNAKINISCPDLEFVLLSCTGSESQQRITITGCITNKSRDRDGGEVRIMSAIDSDGNTYSDCSSTVGYYNTKKMPYGIPLKESFYVNKVFDRLGSLVHVELRIRGCEVIIKDLPVVWK